MSHERVNDRFYSYAKVIMDGIPGYMRDISRDGFKFVTILPCSPARGEMKEITVISQEGSFATFKLSGEIRWVKKDSEGFQVCGIRADMFESDRAEETYRELQRLFSP